MSRNTESTRHPERGHRYPPEELRQLADDGDPWAIGKLDEWEQRFANPYAGDLRDRCPDGDCEQFGEPANICCSEDGSILEIDHGSWAHSLAQLRAKAS